jgi:O-antigen ligase
MGMIAVIIRPKFFKKLLLVGLPAGVLASLVAPSVALGILRDFLDPTALIESQYSVPGWRGSGRLADLGPNLTIAMQHPFFGTGVGSRIVSGERTNAFILDNQILTSFLETGIVGVLGILVLFWLPIGRLWRFARSPTTPDRFTDLAVALVASMIGYFASLFFFDGFGFLQTLMIFAVMLAVGGWLITEVPYTRRPRSMVRPATSTSQMSTSRPTPDPVE